MYELHEEDGSTKYIKWNHFIRNWQWGSDVGILTQDLPIVNFNEITKEYVYYEDGKIEDIKSTLGQIYDKQTIRYQEKYEKRYKK
jgi:hypothetical protein